MYALSMTRVVPLLIFPKAYFDEQQKALEYIRKSPDLSNEEKKRFFKSANTNLGSSALCLSGGGSFGYCGLK